MASSLTAWSSALPSVSTSAAKGPSSRRHRQVCYTTPHKVLRFTRRYGRLVCTRAAYSSGHWKPDGGGRRGICSIRNDLDVPFSPVMQWGDGPSMQLYQRFDSVISQLFQHRIIRCGGPVEDDMANIIVAQLLYLDAMDPHKDIVMYINSPGGSVTAGMAIYDTMKHIHPDVSTVCIGVAASMAAFLLSAGTKGKRFSLPNSRIMIHQPSADTEGSLSEREIQMHEMLHHRAVLGGYLAYNTGQSFEKIDEDSRYDFFMSAEEAVRYGLIDGVLTNPLKARYPRSESDNQEPVAR